MEKVLKDYEKKKMNASNAKCNNPVSGIIFTFKLVDKSGAKISIKNAFSVQIFFRKGFSRLYPGRW